MICRFSARRLAALVFLAAAIPFGIAGHLLGEAVALDHESLWALVFAERHIYLLTLGAVALAFLFLIGRGPRCAHRASHARELIRALPFGGQGVRFAALSFAFQVAFFGVTQAIEGCPIQGGDLLAGLLVALAAALIGALFLALFQRNLVVFALLMSWTNAKQSDRERKRPQPAPFARFAKRRGAFLFSIASRPPPVLAAFPNR
ncbi:MAG: hypothetical protein ABSE64_08745 [Vulcanimicrobiaceae bacterium]